MVAQLCPQENLSVKPPKQGYFATVNDRNILKSFEMENTEPNVQLLPLPHYNKRKLHWMDRDEKLLLTLTREDESVPWGFSLLGGSDILEQGGYWSGVATRRHERGVWLVVDSVRDEYPARISGLKKRDFVLRINGRIVFHLDPKDIQRLIANSGKTLFLDIERNEPKSMLYNSGLHQLVYNFLCTDITRDYACQRNRYSMFKPEDKFKYKITHANDLFI